MLHPTALTQLASDCSDCADDSWGGIVEVTQDEDGCLLFVSFSEEGNVETVMKLVPYGTALGGEELWQCAEKDVVYEPGHKPVISLVPKAICGLLGL